MFRTAAAFVKEMGGISEQPLLTREQMIQKETKNGGRDRSRFPYGEDDEAAGTVKDP